MTEEGATLHSRLFLSLNEKGDLICNAILDISDNDDFLWMKGIMEALMDDSIQWIDPVIIFDFSKMVDYLIKSYQWGPHQTLSNEGVAVVDALESQLKEMLAKIDKARGLPAAQEETP